MPNLWPRVQNGITGQSLSLIVTPLPSKPQWNVFGYIFEANLLEDNIFYENSFVLEEFTIEDRDKLVVY